MAYVLYERNDLQGAAHSAEIGVQLSELGGHLMAKMMLYSCLAQKLLAMGDVAHARAIMGKADEAAHHFSMDSADRKDNMILQIAFALQQDNLKEAIEWDNQLSRYSDGRVGIWRQHITARLLIAKGEKESAANKLRDSYHQAAQAEAQGYMIKIRVYQALAAATTAEALTFLSEALIKGQPEGFIRTFADEGKLLDPLLRKALAQGVTPEYTAKLINIIETERRQSEGGNGGGTVTEAPSCPLSERELEILRLVAAGLSNPQIAETLIIAVGTAKTHVHHIFEKLSANGRLEAVTKAKRLNLI